MESRYSETSLPAQAGVGVDEIPVDKIPLVETRFIERIEDVDAGTGSSINFSGS
jgi:hypothetical protein